MKGHKFLKVTGILMIIAAVFYLIVGVLIGSLGALAAGFGAADGLTGSYYVALLVMLVGGICQLIAGIKGVKHSQSRENSKICMTWGIVVVAFSILASILNMVNDSEFDVTSFVTGLIVPGLYIYGAVLNSRAEDTRATKSEQE